MLALSRLHQEWIIAILAAVAVWIIGRWALRRMVRSLVGQFEAQRPRAQPLTFVNNLRKQFFNNPFAVMKLLWSDERNGYALKLWRDAGPVAARAEQERTALVSSALENPLAGRGHLSVQTHDLPVDELKVHRMHLPDGRPIAVVTLPPPERAA